MLEKLRLMRRPHLLLSYVPLCLLFCRGLLGSLSPTMVFAYTFVPMPKPYYNLQHKQKKGSSISLSATIAPPADSIVNEAKAVTPTSTKVGVLLLQLGGPEKSEDVEGFLYNLFADPDIIRLPFPLSIIQPLIAALVSKKRAPESRAAYDSIGGGSPILAYTTAQAKLLEEELSSTQAVPGITFKTYVAMRYWKPFTETAMAQVRADNVDALVVLPLYPHFSVTTSGSSLRVLQEEFAAAVASADDRYDDHRGGTQSPSPTVHTVVPSWHTRPGYLRCIADLIQNELDSFTKEELEVGNGKRHVLFSAHSVPKSYVEDGDPYQQQIEECVDSLEQMILADQERNSGVEIHLSYQSRVGPVEWLRPYTDDILPELGERGVKNLVVVPISFVSEHIETLEEIDMEYRELAESVGIEHWRRCPALNTSPAFVTDLAKMVREALEEPVHTVTEVCVANGCGEPDLKSVDQRLVGLPPPLSSSGSNTLVTSPTERDEAVERLHGRVAMLGVAGTMVLELFSGNSVMRMFGL